MTNKTPSYFYMSKKITIASNAVLYCGADIFEGSTSLQLKTTYDKLSLGFIRDTGTVDQVDTVLELSLNISEQLANYHNQTYVSVQQVRACSSIKHSEYQLTYEIVPYLLEHLCTKITNNPCRGYWDLLLHTCLWFKEINQSYRLKYGADKVYIPLADAMDEFRKKWVKISHLFPEHGPAMAAMFMMVDPSFSKPDKTLEILPA